MSSEYARALAEAMQMLAEDPRTIFLGQAVTFPGTAQSGTLKDIPRRIEMPVAEEMQMGISIGLALAGHVPVTIYPRWNFLLLAANQLVNHLDKLPLMGGYRPRVIVRVGVGAATPMHPGPQHLGDFTDAFVSMLKTVRVRQLNTPDEVRRCYAEALKFEGSTILTEYGALF